MRKLDDLGRTMNRDPLHSVVSEIIATTIPQHGKSQDDATLLAVRMVQELSTHPAFAVRLALQQHRQQVEWWPTIAGTLKRIEAITAPLRALRKALQAQARLQLQGQRFEPRQPPSEGLKAKFDALLDELNADIAMRQASKPRAWTPRPQRNLVVEQMAQQQQYEEDRDHV